MASSPAALVALMIASCAATAAATTFDVGDGHGWDTGVDYTEWTVGKTFAVGDTLVFNYTSKAHTVTEVSKSGYDACSGGNSVSTDDSGATTVTLTIPGVHYFICSVPGHCAGGMKLVVTVVAAAGGDIGSTTGSAIPAGDAGGSLVPATSAVAAVAVGALIMMHDHAVLMKPVVLGE